MQNKLKNLGTNTSAKAEIQNISHHGLWILADNEEFFVPFADYPYFLGATIEQIYNLEFFHGHHLNWPLLDIDIDIEALKHPELYPLKYS